MSWAYVIRPWERELFKRCRRAWDLGSRSRRDLELREGPPVPDLQRALREALAVYYFPGMWTWNREIVKPLAFQAFQRTLEEQAARHPGPPDPEGAFRERVDACEVLLDRYLLWAKGHDHFEPLRVEAEFSVNLPDPDRAGVDLTTAAGEPIRYRGRIPLLVIEGGVQWIVEHRLSPLGFADPEDLRLDERGALDCWAWEASSLGTKVAGVLVNEIVGGAGPEPFRRTRVLKSEVERERRRRDLAAEAREMTNPALTIYPNPSEQHCPRCPYRAPCLALNEGGDVVALLDTRFRRRVTEDESRIGRVSWSLGRGAAPPPPDREGS
jgi:hypothetical protein